MSENIFKKTKVAESDEAGEPGFEQNLKNAQQEALNFLHSILKYAIGKDEQKLKAAEILLHVPQNLSDSLLETKVKNEIKKLERQRVFRTRKIFRKIDPAQKL